MPLKLLDYFVDYLVACLTCFYQNRNDEIVDIVDAVPITRPIEEPHIKIKLHYDDICWG